MFWEGGIRFVFKFSTKSLIHFSWSQNPFFHILGGISLIWVTTGEFPSKASWNLLFPLIASQAFYHTVTCHWFLLSSVILRAAWLINMHGSALSWMIIFKWGISDKFVGKYHELYLPCCNHPAVAAPQSIGSNGVSCIERSQEVHGKRVVERWSNSKWYRSTVLPKSLIIVDKMVSGRNWLWIRIEYIIVYIQELICCDAWRTATWAYPFIKSTVKHPKLISQLLISILLKKSMIIGNADLTVPSYKYRNIYVPHPYKMLEAIVAWIEAKQKDYCSIEVGLGFLSNQIKYCNQVVNFWTRMGL